MSSVLHPPLVNLSAALPEFRVVLGDRFVLTRAEELAVYECDACLLVKVKPQAVLLPKTTDDVVAIVRICHQYQIPYVARGAGTGLSGGALTTEGGVIIGLNRMNQIESVDLVKQIATVQVGVVNGWLNEHLNGLTADAGKPLFFAPDPSSQSASTIGGNIAENAGGIHCLKYGVTTDHVLALEVVWPNGTVSWVGSQTRQTNGYNLLGVLVGSEGTLAVITRAVVRLTPKPKTVATFLAAFERLENSTQCVESMMAEGILPAALEFIDAYTIRAVNEAFQIGFPEQSEAVLLIELDGHPLSVSLSQERVINRLKAHHASQIRLAETEADRLALWKARKGAVAAYGRYYPAFYVHDLVIPRSQITPILSKIAAIAAEHQVPIGNVFHAGDGNLHPNILFDPDDEAMVQRVLAAGAAIMEACLAVGGTLSGEHGIGIEKSEFMSRLFSEADLNQMKQIKTVFDPEQLANPGKIFPMRAGCGESRLGENHLGQNPVGYHHTIASPLLTEGGAWI